MKIEKGQVVVFGVVDYNLGYPSYNQIVVKAKIDVNMTEIWHEYKNTVEESSNKNINDFLKYIINNKSIFEIVDAVEVTINNIHHIKNGIILDTDLNLITRNLNKKVFSDNGFDCSSYSYHIQ